MQSNWWYWFYLILILRAKPVLPFPAVQPMTLIRRHVSRAIWEDTWIIIPSKKYFLYNKQQQLSNNKQQQQQQQQQQHQHKSCHIIRNPTKRVCFMSRCTVTEQLRLLLELLLGPGLLFHLLFLLRENWPSPGSRWKKIELFEVPIVFCGKYYPYHLRTVSCLSWLSFYGLMETPYLCKLKKTCQYVIFLGFEGFWRFLDGFWMVFGWFLDGFWAQPPLRPLRSSLSCPLRSCSTRASTKHQDPRRRIPTSSSWSCRSCPGFEPFKRFCPVSNENHDKKKKNIGFSEPLNGEEVVV